MAPPQLEEHFVRLSADKQAAGSNTLVLKDGAYAFRSSWTTRDTVARGTAPNGLIVPFVLYGAIAALPDSLPSVVTLWTWSLDTMKPEEARVEFEDPAEIRVPLVMPGNECSEDPMVRYATLPAVATTMHFAGRTFHFQALAHRPHVVVSEGQGLKCLRLSSAGGQ
jgi:hypothetical protein